MARANTSTDTTASKSGAPKERRRAVLCAGLPSLSCLLTSNSRKEFSLPNPFAKIVTSFSQSETLAPTSYSALRGSSVSEVSLQKWLRGKRPVCRLRSLPTCRSNISAFSRSTCESGSGCSTTLGTGSGGGGLRCLGGTIKLAPPATTCGTNTRMMWIERRLREYRSLKNWASQRKRSRCCMRK